LSAFDDHRAMLAGFTADLNRQIDRVPAGRDIPPEMTFRQWCDRLADEGLKVDGKPFRLDNRRSLWAIYDAIPSTPEAAYQQMMVIQKAAQMGLTVWEMLACIYMARKFSPATCGFYLPDMPLAGYVSRERWLPVVRSIPNLYRELTIDEGPAGKSRSKGEGNVLTRRIGDAVFLFLWTSGKVTTESYPMDVLAFDEVQGMQVDDIDRTRERLSASNIRYTMAVSTAKWPNADINWFFKLGTQREFHTRCPNCGEHMVLSSLWPDCVAFDRDADRYRYRCAANCEAWIDDTQEGEWKATVPAAKIESWHLSQILSPTISADEMMESWSRAATSDQKQNFYNRKLGMPYADPTQIPVTLEHLNQCVAEGARAGVEWLDRATGTYMGIDQMGQFNVAIIKARLPDGRQAVVHVEAIYNDDPFERCSGLMERYGVSVCVVESLPNYNDAKRFAGRHKGRVFLAHYTNLADDMLAWGDAVVTKADRRTRDEDRDRYTVALHQYKMMQVALDRYVKHTCLLPPPDKREQDILDGGVRKRVAILREMVFLHLTRVALVSEPDEEVRDYRPRVVKVGLDPHFAFANMLCEAAWARAYGTGTFYLPSGPTAAEQVERRTAAQNMPGLPAHVVEMMDGAQGRSTCGQCEAFDATRGHCRVRGFSVGASDPDCPLFVALPAP
jgi:hypothetical protein